MLPENFRCIGSSSLKPVCQQLNQDYADINIRHDLSIDVNVNFLSGNMSDRFGCMKYKAGHGITGAAGVVFFMQ